ncbi:MAG TPA: TraX family protein [Albitalea sp.]
MPAARLPADDLARAASRPAPVAIPDGTLEAIKWLALALMVLDHVNTFLYDRTLPGAFQAGRLVFPLFAFVLGCNLARPGAFERGVHGRVVARLALFAVLATPAHWALVGRWWPLNILVTLLAATLTVYGLERRDAWGVVLAGAAFLAGGLVGDYFYPGVAMAVAAWAYCRRPRLPRLLAWVAATASLATVNFNFWALAALPLLWIGRHADLRVPRLRWFFYAVYPLHLALIWWWRDGERMLATLLRT